jgi:hypothetical protein
LAGYTTNSRYYGVLRNFDASWDNLGRYIREYESTLEAWNDFKKGVNLV